MTIDPDHLDADQLCDLAEDLLDRNSADTVRLHLTTCASCADDYALIAGAADLFARIELEPIPAEFMTRIEAALHREPPLRVQAAGPAPAVQHKARKPLSQRFRLAFGGLAMSAVVIAGGLLAVSVLSSSEVDPQGSHASPARLTAAPNGAKAASGAGADTATFGATLPPVAAAALQSRASQLLAAAPKSPGTAGLTSADAISKPGAAAAAKCWSDPRPSSVPLATGPYAFDGGPAELYVYADPGDATKADVIVVSAGCLNGSPQSSSLATPHVLAQTQIPRP